MHAQFSFWREGPPPLFTFIFITYTNYLFYLGHAVSTDDDIYTMRLSANILHSAEQRTNPIGEREIILRSLAIPAIEHLAVTRDQFDTIDLSNNYISRIENFPRLERLTCLYLHDNNVTYVDRMNLKKNVPNLTTVVLTGNGVTGWNVINDLGQGCPKLEYLSLVGNPITSKCHALYNCKLCFYCIDGWVRRGGGSCSIK